MQSVKPTFDYIQHRRLPQEKSNNISRCSRNLSGRAIVEDEDVVPFEGRRKMIKKHSYICTLYSNTHKVHKNTDLLPGLQYWGVAVQLDQVWCDTKNFVFHHFEKKIAGK